MSFPLLDILSEDKTINRRALGRKVFGNQVVWIIFIYWIIFQHFAELQVTCQISLRNLPEMGCFFCLFFPQQERLKALTDIVWPEIALLVQKRINQARDEGIV